MKRSWQVFEKFEQDLIGSTPVDYFANLRIVDELFRQAKAMGVFPLKEPLAGIEIDIERTRIFNSVRRHSQTNSKRS